MPWRGPQIENEFPTLGHEICSWIESWCVIPDGDHAGEPFKLSPWQEQFIMFHYRLKLDASANRPTSAFRYRRSQLTLPQKTGKGPFSAALICAEAVGPVLFAGWDANGEPMGRAWETPLIQVTASSQEQADNVYAVLVPMITDGPLTEYIPDAGITRINLPGGGRIDPVTSKARSRLGQRVTFAVQDETGTWTESNGGVALADTQKRGLAGMGGRAIETTNAWSVSENSVAQQTYELSSRDVYLQMAQAPPELDYMDPQDRRRIHEIVYAGSWWVDLDRINAEADELVDRDPGQAQRFFGNRLVQAQGSWISEELWTASERPMPADLAAVLNLEPALA